MRNPQRSAKCIIKPHHGRHGWNQEARKGLKRLCNAYIRWTKAGALGKVNGLMRFFFPKGADFPRVSAADIGHAENCINRTVRKTSLNGRSAHKVFQDRSKVA